MGFIGGIAKWVLNPIISWVMGLLYGLLIRGPLTLLSYINKAFQYVSGSETDRLLFSTSMVDGKPELNFFTSDSPLKYFFLIMLGVAGALLAAFIGIVMVKSLSNKKGQGPVSKFGKVIINSSIVFALPAMFLMVLSLSGGVLGAINGGHISVSKSNINDFSTVTKKKLDMLSSSSTNLKDDFDSSFKIQGMKDDSDKGIGPGKDVAYSLEEIYQNFEDKSIWKVSDNVKTLASQTQDKFQLVKKLLVQSNFQGGYKLNETLENEINDVKATISQLKPGMKDNNLSDRVKVLENRLQNIQDAINDWVSTSKSLIAYEGKDQTQLPNRAIKNYRIAFGFIYGNKPDKDLMNITNLSSIQELNQLVAYLINGSPSNPSSGLTLLKTSLNTIEEDPLVVAFYRTATGNKDSNWDRGIVHFSNSRGSMLLMGSLLIMAAIVIMLLSVLFAVGRIFDLALLFIISPVVVTTSVFDDGSRFKSWMNMFIAKLISIFGIVISLRLFGTLDASFIKGMSNSSMFEGDSGFLMKQILAAIFGIGGLMAAYKSSSTLSGIVGAGYGIMDGLQVGQTLGILRGAGRMTGLSIASGKKMIGLQGTSPSNIPGVPGAGGLGPGGGNRSRLGQVKSTWSNRLNSIKNKGNKINKASATLTGGLVGTKKTKYDRLQNKKAKASQKHFKKADTSKLKASNKEMYSSALKEHKQNKKRGK